MELRHLRYFVAVVEEGSLTTAAELRPVSFEPISDEVRVVKQFGNQRLMNLSALRVNNATARTICIVRNYTTR